MTLKEQFRKIKDNWLLVAFPIILLFVLIFGAGMISSIFSGVSNFGAETYDGYSKSYAPMAMEADYAVSSREYYPGPSSGGFAPEAEDRMVSKTATLSSEVERGAFSDAEAKLKAVVSSSGAFMLDQNVNTYGKGVERYTSGNYNIKIDSKKYDSIITQLKAIGEVKTFNENADDITASYLDLKTQIENEKKRLDRYNEMYAEAETITEKLEVSDRILNQENTIDYMQKMADNLENQVDYSTVYLSISEKRSGYAGISFVGISDLAAAIVGSTALLLLFGMGILPWVIAIAVIVFIIRRLRRKKRK